MRLRTPSDVVTAAASMAASCSTSLTTRRPSAGSTSRSVTFSTRPVEPTQPRSTSTRKAGASCVARSANGFQAITPTRAPSTMPSSPRMSRSGRDRSRGWDGSDRSWCSSRRIASGAAPAIP
jgi:hypothetical protein